MSSTKLRILYFLCIILPLQHIMCITHTVFTCSFLAIAERFSHNVCVCIWFVLEYLSVFITVIHILGCYSLLVQKFTCCYRSWFFFWMDRRFIDFYIRFNQLTVITIKIELEHRKNINEFSICAMWNF